ncbi:hypothetical protein Tco_0052502 [Tanacetum coccineum]
MVHMLTKPQVFYDNNMKQALGFQNHFYLKKAQQIRPMLYDRNVIAKETNVISIADSEETLMLEEESRSKMLLKQTSHPITDQSASSPVKIEAPRELPKMSNATTITPRMYKLDPVNLAPKDKNNRKAHKYYLKHTMEQAAILREVVEQAKSRNPLDSESYSTCMYVKLIQELLGYVRDTCPDIHKPSEKLVAVTPINKKKTVRFADTVTSSCNSPKVTNRPIFMNVRAKSASKKNKKRKEWKPTGKVFNSIRYKWKPTGRNFTLVGNECHLTRIPATNKVPLKVPIPLEVVAPTHVVTRVYIRRPKVPKSVQNSKPKVVKFMTANRMEPGTSRGSNTLVAPSSSSLINCRLSKSSCGIWTPDALST